MDQATASDLVSSGPISRVIMKKWIRYRSMFYIWFFIHLVYTCVLSWYAVERANRDDTRLLTDNMSCPRSISEHGLTRTFHFVNMAVALVYIIIEILRITKLILRRRSTNANVSDVVGGIWRSVTNCLVHPNPYGNGWFRICFFLMSVFLITDLALVYQVDCYDNYMLLVAVIISWFLFLFFIRCWQRFSFFTLLIQKIMLNEMLSFFVILGIQIAAFGTALYMLVQGTPIQEEEGYSSYWRLLFSLVKLAVGTEELNDLYSTKYPGLTIGIYIAYVVMTLLLLLNALIAVLSETATELVDLKGRSSQSAHYTHFLLQRLSIILFIESFIPESLYKAASNKVKKDLRRVITMKSLREPGSTANDDEANIDEQKEPDEPEETKVVSNVKQRQTWSNPDHDNPCELDVYHVQPVTRIQDTFVSGRSRTIF